MKGSFQSQWSRQILKCLDLRRLGAQAPVVCIGLLLGAIYVGGDSAMAQTSAGSPAAEQMPSVSQTSSPKPASPMGSASDAATSRALGAGDTLSVSVQGQPQMTTTAYVADDGSVALPLIGNIVVSGLAPDVAAQKIAKALRDGGYFVDPQVSVLLTKYLSQQISVLGEVRTPARYPLEAKTSIFDLLAEAGGITENGSDQILLLRTDDNGLIRRVPIDLSGMIDGSRTLPTLNLQAGDTVYVPRAQHYFIAGEVQAPNMYRLEPDMTVMQAIARGGGLTQRGSRSRIEIERKNSTNGEVFKISASPDDKVLPDDVIRVKERLF